MATKKTTFIPGITSSGSLPGIVTQSEQKARETYGMHFYHIDNIVPSNKNKRYPQIDLESLAASIIDVGLLHNLVVTKTDQKDTVRLISGERRYRACCLIRDEYPDDFKRLFPNGMLIFFLILFRISRICFSPCEIVLDIFFSVKENRIRSFLVHTSCSSYCKFQC